MADQINDPNKNNLLYKPDLYPERTHRSEAQFDDTLGFPPGNAQYYPDNDYPESSYSSEARKEYIDDYKELEDLIGGLPEDLAPLEDIIPLLRLRAEIIDREQELIAGGPQDTPIRRVSTGDGDDGSGSKITIGSGDDDLRPKITIGGGDDLPDGNIHVGDGTDYPDNLLTVKGGGDLPDPTISIGGGSDYPSTGFSVGSGDGSGTGTGITTGSGKPRKTYTIPPPNRDKKNRVRIFVPTSSSGSGSSTNGPTGSSGSGSSTNGSSGSSIPGSSSGVQWGGGTLTGSSSGLGGSAGDGQLYAPIIDEDNRGVLVDVLNVTGGTIYEYEIPSYYDDAFNYHRQEAEDIAGSTFSPEENTAVYIGTNITEEIETVDGLPPLIPKQSNIILEITTPKSIVQTVQEGYLKDQIDLQRKYLENMRGALQKYFQHQLAIMAELNIGDLDLFTRDYDGNNVTVGDGNLRHLHDTIIRSQLQRRQKALYFKKVANTDLTLTHMRSWNAAEKERERYYSEAYGSSDNFIDSESNALLRQARSDYDAAYNRSLYNMMKYLNSSVEITEDILNHTITESKAKAKLLKAGVNIFQTEEYEYPTEGVSTTQPKTNEQAEAEKASAANKDEGASTPTDTASLDKAMGIEDPASEAIWGVSPAGCHYSLNDINYLSALGGIYSADTDEGRSAIKNTLNNSNKYAGSVSSSSTASENKGTGQTKTSSNEKVEQVVTEDLPPTTKTFDIDDTAETIRTRIAELGLEGYSISTHSKLFSGKETRVHKKYPDSSVTIYMHKTSKKGKIYISGESAGSKSFSEKEIAADSIKQAALTLAKDELSQLNMN